MTIKLGKRVLIALNLLLWLTQPLLASEWEIVLSEEYQTKSESRLLEDRFRLDLSVSYGFSPGQELVLQGFYTLGANYTTYLKRLGLEFSAGYVGIRITASYVIRPKMGIYVAIPFGLVEVESESNKTKGNSLSETVLIKQRNHILKRRNIRRDMWKETKAEFGIGDIYGGFYYRILDESKRQPSLTCYFDINSPLADYTSLGDGLWGFTWGMDLRKFVVRRLYFYGVFDYTYRLNKNNLNPGDIIGYGGGMGFLVKRTFGLEIGLKRFNIGEAKLGDYVLVEDTDDLVLRLTGNFKRWSFSFIVAGLDEGWHWENNYFGGELTFHAF